MNSLKFDNICGKRRCIPMAFCYQENITISDIKILSHKLKINNFEQIISSNINRRSTAGN